MIAVSYYMQSFSMCGIIFYLFYYDRQLHSIIFLSDIMAWLSRCRPAGKLWSHGSCCSSSTGT